MSGRDSWVTQGQELQNFNIDSYFSVASQTESEFEEPVLMQFRPNREFAEVMTGLATEGKEKDPNPFHTLEGFQETMKDSHLDEENYQEFLGELNESYPFLVDAVTDPENEEYVVRRVAPGMGLTNLSVMASPYAVTGLNIYYESPYSFDPVMDLNDDMALVGEINPGENDLTWKKREPLDTEWQDTAYVTLEAEDRDPENRDLKLGFMNDQVARDSEPRDLYLREGDILGAHNMNLENLDESVDLETEVRDIGKQTAIGPLHQYSVRDQAGNQVMEEYFIPLEGYDEVAEDYRARSTPAGVAVDFFLSPARWTRKSVEKMSGSEAD